MTHNLAQTESPEIWKGPLSIAFSSSLTDAATAALFLGRVFKKMKKLFKKRNGEQLLTYSGASLNTSEEQEKPLDIQLSPWKENG